MRLNGSFLAVVASAVAGCAAHAACGPASSMLVEVAVREAALVTQRDLSVAQLQAMAAQLGGRVAHPILGLYAGTVGYEIRELKVVANPPSAQAQDPCPGVRIRADLVVVDRRIVVASDLSGTSCLLGVALDHYHRHAAAAQVALQEFASGLPAAIAPEADRYVQGRPDMPRDGDRNLRSFVDALLDRAVAEFSAYLPEVQARVDSPEEVRSLTTPCGAT